MTKGYLYFLSNATRTILHVGATKNLVNGIRLHEKGRGSKFTKKHHLKFLMYYEEFEDISNAYVREKQIKNWHKDWKWNLIKKVNPDLQDLSTRLK